jgi:hypothetical protein
MIVSSRGFGFPEPVVIIRMLEFRRRYIADRWWMLAAL